MFCIIFFNFRSGEKKKVAYKKEINSYICKGKHNRWEESQNEKPRNAILVLVFERIQTNSICYAVSHELLVLRLIKVC